MSRKSIDGWQGFLGLVGLTLGAFPLVQNGLGIGRGGLWRFVLGDDADAARWVVPLVVLVVAVVGIAVLERRKRNA